MIKVQFMKPDGDQLEIKDMRIDEIQLLKLVDRIDFNDVDISFKLEDMDYNPDTKYLRVWLKEE